MPQKVQGHLSCPEGLMLAYGILYLAGFAVFLELVVRAPMSEDEAGP